MKKLIIFCLIPLLLLFFGTVSAQEESASRRLYTVTAPYLTVTDDISFEGLSSFWKGECDILPGTDDVSVILISEDETDALTSVFGAEPDGDHIKALPRSEIYLDPNLAGAWMIVPFEDIEPRRKVIFLDGADILYNQFDPDIWPLTAVIGEVP